MGNGIDRGQLTGGSLGHLASWLAIRCPQVSNNIGTKVLHIEFPSRREHPPLTIQPFADYRRHSKHLRERIGIKSTAEARGVLARIDGKAKAVKKLSAKLGHRPSVVASYVDDALAAAARRRIPKRARRAADRNKDAVNQSARDEPISLGSKEADDGAGNAEAPYIPQSGDDRELISRQIRQRRGQQKFRNSLLRRYRRRCVVSDCSVQDLLEAAHNKAYRLVSDNNLQNGLLLRADLHTLFDLDLLGIEPSTMRVMLHPVVACEPNYKGFDGRKLSFPRGLGASLDALTQRYRRFQTRLLQS